MCFWWMAASLNALAELWISDESAKQQGVAKCSLLSYVSKILCWCYNRMLCVLAFWVNCGW